MPQNTASHTPPLLYSYREVAARLAVTVWHVRELVNSGQLPTVYVGSQRRVLPKDLDEFVAGLSYMGPA